MTTISKRKTSVAQPNTDAVLHERNVLNTDGNPAANEPNRNSALLSGDYARSAASALFPPLARDQYEALRLDIQANGQRVPIVLHGLEVIDGWHRLQICRELGIEPRVESLGASIDPMQYSISINLARRHLSTSEKAMIAAKISLAKEVATHESNALAAPENPPFTVAEVAARFGVSERSVRSARKVVQTRDEALIQKASSGEIAISVASEIASAADPLERQSRLARALNTDDDALQRKHIATTLRQLARHEISDINPLETDPETATLLLQKHFERFEKAAAGFADALLKLDLDSNAALENVVTSSKSITSRVNAAIKALLKRTAAVGDES